MVHSCEIQNEPNKFYVSLGASSMGVLVSVALMNGFVGCQSPCNVTTKDPDGVGMIHHRTGILSPRTLFVMPAS